MKKKVFLSVFVLLLMFAACSNENLMSFDSNSASLESAISESIKVQAEDFDSQSGLKIETTSDMDGGENVGYINSGDYAIYKVNVGVAGTYSMKFRVATSSNGGKISVLLDNVESTEVAVSSTNKGWQSWFETSSVDVYLSQGTNNIRLNFEGNDDYLFNINWFSLSLKTSSVGVTLVTSKAIKSIPRPTLGNRWIVNWDYTDEFNGSTLDDIKWYNYHPTWKGRAPGYFSKDNVKVKDGYLQLCGGLPQEDIVVTNWDKSKTTYTKTCAACVSKKQTASYGYYECKFKANKTTLSSTFWFSSRGNFSSPVGDNFSEELDVCECIGRSGDFSGSSMYDGMNSNAHYWYSATNGTKYDMRASTPNGAAWQTGVTQNLAVNNKPSDKFHTYGCWWIDKSSSKMYLDNNDGVDFPFNFKMKDGQPSVDVKKCVFDHPMGLNLVVETYPSPWVALPTDEEITNPNKNTTYYDWVRSYTLVSCNQENSNKKKMYMFKKHVHCTDKPSRAYVGGVGFKLAYTCDEDCSLIVKIYSKDNKVLKVSNFDAKAGYSFKKYWISYNATKGSKYYVFTYLLPKGINDVTKSYEVDSFETVVE